MIPTREEAERLLKDAETCNLGEWASHCRITAKCAEKIAIECDDMNADKAYVLGLLHDVGRKFGRCQLKHVYAGWQYMLQLGYDEVARTCLTHSFPVKRIGVYIGKFDIDEEQQSEIERALQEIEYDDYDRLIQLCDCVAGAAGTMTLKARMTDAENRYGKPFPKDNWDTCMNLQKYFERKSGKSIYDIIKYKE